MKNLFIRLLDALSVPYTEDFAEELYATHPNRDNMLGLCQMCAAYGITSKGVNVKDKCLDVLSIPSVLHVGGHFIILTEVSDKDVTYDWNGQTTIQEKDNFSNAWDGNALLIESDNGAIEPSYSEHRRQEWSQRIQTVALASLVMLCGGIMLIQSSCLSTAQSSIFAWIDVLGIGICYLLLQKQAFSTSKIGDKVCSMFHQKDCNDILFSEKAKVYGYSWSEIGFGYFVAHFLIASLLPSATLLLSAVSWCAMCYGIWSIYYQAYVAKQWCVLCVLVQALLWVNGIAAIILRSEISHISEFQALLWVRNGVYFLSVMAISIWAIHQIVASVAFKKSLLKVTYQYRSLKGNKNVFEHLLRQSEYVPTSIEDSGIVFGNKNSQLRITVLTNPHCNPCAAKHIQVDNLLEKYGAQLSVQYIFLAFNERLKQSNRFLIAAYQQRGEAVAREIYRKWYESGKNHATSFMANYPEILCDTPSVEQEMLHHASWIVNSGFSATPTILVNGYVLPPEYELEDLPLFVDN